MRKVDEAKRHNTYLKNKIPHGNKNRRMVGVLEKRGMDEKWEQQFVFIVLAKRIATRFKPTKFLTLFGMERCRRGSRMAGLLHCTNP